MTNSIYKITCLVTDRVYIGKTNNPIRRFSEHIIGLTSGTHKNPHLQEDYDKYGLNNFSFQVIDEIENNNIYEQEDYWIDYYGGIESDKVYNMKNSKTNNKEIRYKNKQAMLGDSHPMRGKHHTKEAIEKIKLNAKTNPNYGMRGKHHTLQTINKIKQNPGIYSNLGKRKYTQELVDKLREEFLKCGCFNEVIEQNPDIKGYAVRYLIRYGVDFNCKPKNELKDWFNTLPDEDVKKFIDIQYRYRIKTRQKHKLKDTDKEL